VILLVLNVNTISQFLELLKVIVDAFCWRSQERVFLRT
jgi:hypothetical protein